MYLALLPIIFLFLPYRRKEYVYVTLAVSVIGFIAFFYPPTATMMNGIMATVSLPFGYIFIFCTFLLWLLLNVITDPEKKLMKLFHVNLVFALFYTFLWTLSAYGIVWYLSLIHI